jgi:hypothetical protein
VLQSIEYEAYIYNVSFFTFATDEAALLELKGLWSRAASLNHW